MKTKSILGLISGAFLSLSAGAGDPFFLLFLVPGVLLPIASIP